MHQKFEGEGFSNQYTFVRMYLSTNSYYDVIGSDVDFNSDPFNITINAGATDGKATVSVTCDDVTEGLESFDMTLTLISNSSGVILGRDICEGHINDSTGSVHFVKNYNCMRNYV